MSARFVVLDLSGPAPYADAAAFASPLPGMASLEAIGLYAALADRLGRPVRGAEDGPRGKRQPRAKTLFSSGAVQAAVDLAWQECVSTVVPTPDSCA